MECIVVNNTLKIGVKTVATSDWTIFDTFTLTYLVDPTTLKDALAQARTNLEEKETEKQNELNDGLQNLITEVLSSTSDVEETEEALNAAIAKVNETISTVEAVIPVLAKLSAEITLCENEIENSINEDKNDFETAIAQATEDYKNITSVEAANAAISALESARQTYVLTAAPTEGNTLDYTFKIVNAQVASKEGWTNIDINTGQKYTDAPDAYYMDACKWESSTNVTFNMYQKVTLPAGVYTLKAATRGDTSDDVIEGNIYLNESNPYENNAKDINKVGSTGGELGNGWSWTEVNDIIIEEEQEVTIGFYTTVKGKAWTGADDFHLYLVRAITDADKANKAKIQLTADITAAENLNTTANVGELAFQIPTNAVNAIKEAISSATSVNKNENATYEEVANAIDALAKAVETYNNTTLNVPNDGEVFNISITTNDAYSLKNHPFEFNESGTSGVTIPLNDYGFDVNRAQAFIFTQAEANTNNYNLSTIKADGTTVYVCTGAQENGNNTIQIRLTSDASKALAVTVVPTTTDGVYNLLNTENSNATLGCQDDNKDGGLYTTNAHNTLKITPAQKAEVGLSIAAGKYATRIFPFKPDFSETDVQVYSCETVGDNSELSLIPVTDAAANTPYILYSENGCNATVSGLGAAYNSTYSAGLLTGVYSSEGNFPTGSYVLQTLNEKQAFYVVSEEDAIALAPYRAYLTAPVESNVKAFFLDGDDATVINGVESAEGVTVVGRYNAAGIKVNAPVKGINILKMSDGTVKKVLIK